MRERSLIGLVAAVAMASLALEPIYILRSDDNFETPRKPKRAPAPPPAIALTPTRQQRRLAERQAQKLLKRS